MISSGDYDKNKFLFFAIIALIDNEIVADHKCQFIMNEVELEEMSL